MRRYALLTLVLLAVSASAQVHKCTDSSGKVSYVDGPCRDPGAKDKKISGPVQRSKSDEANEQAYANRKAWNTTNERETRPTQERYRYAAPEEKKGPTDEQVIAACEANRGADCRSPDVIEFEKGKHRVLSQDEMARQDTIAKMRARGQRFP